jgi:hypothetical protein
MQREELSSLLLVDVNFFSQPLVQFNTCVFLFCSHMLLIMSVVNTHKASYVFPYSIYICIHVTSCI